MYPTLVVLIGAFTLAAVVLASRRERKRARLRREVDAWVFAAREVQERKRRKPRARA